MSTAMATGSPVRAGFRSPIALNAAPKRVRGFVHELVSIGHRLAATTV